MLEATATQAFSLTQTDINIINEAAEKMARPNRSEALRKILREWAYWAEQRRQAERPEFPGRVN